MTAGKLIVHTDVILDYLSHTGPAEHPFRRAMRSHFCYTTVFSAIELFSLAATDQERLAIEQALSAVKLLGLNARHARDYGARLAAAGPLPRMNGLIACMSIESGVPILTGRPEEFSGFDGLTIVSPDSV